MVYCIRSCLLYQLHVFLLCSYYHLNFIFASVFLKLFSKKYKLLYGTCIFNVYLMRLFVAHYTYNYKLLRNKKPEPSPRFLLFVIFNFLCRFYFIPLKISSAISNPICACCSGVKAWPVSSSVVRRASFRRFSAFCEAVSGTILSSLP